jgi:SAM-dependent methyltransferase
VPEPQRTASGVRYAYRDGDAAAERLAAVNELFEPPYRSLIEAAHPGTVDLAIDVGCGPGFTTRLLSAVLKPRSLAGLDISAHFIKQARASGPPDIAWYVHDVTQVPFPTGPADLIHSRWVLAHLANPETVLVSWLSQLRPRGRLLIQEDEQIDAEHPVLAAYQAMSTSLVVHHGGDLYVARRIDRLQIPPGYRTTLNRLYPHNVPAPAAARIFAMNFAIWRDDPWITENHTTRELDAMASDLDRIATSTEHSEVVFTLHQFAFAHVTAPE